VGDLRVESHARTGAATALVKLGDRERALSEFSRALEIARGIHDRQGESLALYGLGELHAAAHRPPQALEAFEQCLALRRGEPAEAAKTLAAMAKVLRESGDLDAARAKAEEAISLAESFRAGIGTPFRASYLGSVLKYYELDVDLLMRLHDRSPREGLDARALETSERSRARSLAEMLIESRVNVREGADPALLDQEGELRRKLRSKLDEQARPGAGASEENRRAVDTLQLELQQVQARIRSKSPRYAALVLPQPDRVPQMQELLDRETLLLQFGLGEERSFVWAVTWDGLVSRALPGRREIEAAARNVCERAAAPGQAGRVDS